MEYVTIFTYLCKYFCFWGLVICSYRGNREGNKRKCSPMPIYLSLASKGSNIARSVHTSTFPLLHGGLSQAAMPRHVNEPQQLSSLPGNKERSLETNKTWCFYSSRILCSCTHVKKEKCESFSINFPFSKNNIHDLHL